MSSQKRQKQKGPQQTVLRVSASPNDTPAGEGVRSAKEYWQRADKGDTSHSSCDSSHTEIGPPPPVPPRPASLDHRMVTSRDNRNIPTLTTREGARGNREGVERRDTNNSTHSSRYNKDMIVPISPEDHPVLHQPSLRWMKPLDGSSPDGRTKDLPRNLELEGEETATGRKEVHGHEVSDDSHDDEIVAGFVVTNSEDSENQEGLEKATEVESQLTQKTEGLKTQIKELKKQLKQEKIGRKEALDKIKVAEGETDDLNRQIREVQAQLDQVEAENRAAKDQIEETTKEFTRQLDQEKIKKREAEDKVTTVEAQGTRKAEELTKQLADVEVHMNQEKAKNAASKILLDKKTEELAKQLDQEKINRRASEKKVKTIEAQCTRTTEELTRQLTEVKEQLNQEKEKNKVALDQEKIKRREEETKLTTLKEQWTMKAKEFNQQLAEVKDQLDQEKIYRKEDNGNFIKKLDQEKEKSITANEIFYKIKEDLSQRLIIETRKVEEANQNFDDVSKNLSIEKDEKEIISAKLDKATKELKLIEDERRRIEEEKARAIPCRVPTGPQALAGIQSAILDQLRNHLEGRQLDMGGSGPALVVVNNSSRLASDIKRDVAKSGITEGPIVLMIIKPTRKAAEEPAMQMSSYREVDSRIVEAGFFLIDINITGLHDCDVNKASASKIAKFLAPRT